MTAAVPSRSPSLIAVAPILTTRAPAKVNLTLHVLGRRPDGYHDLESVVAFAGTGDALSLDPGDGLGLQVEGPMATLAGEPADNLVLRAALHLGDRVPGLRLGRFRLVKRLPVAAGIGGGSSDAAAALRLLAQLNEIPLDDPALAEAARATGADVPVCLVPRARLMRGIGEQLGKALDLPPLFAVLVNPRVPVATPAVFNALGLTPGEMLAGAAHPRLDEVLSREVWLERLHQGRNDLEAPARQVAPIIGETLDRLRDTLGCRLVRMSGSGATVFGLYDGCRTAAAAARAIRQARPDWWVKATRLR